MRRAVSILMLTLWAASCDADAGSRPTSAASVSPICQARPDQATPGCFASPSAMLCSPSGCQSLCAGGQTPVVCSSAQPAGPIPAPDLDAGCSVVPIPTPSSELFYCCPCGAG